MTTALRPSITSPRRRPGGHAGVVGLHRIDPAMTTVAVRGRWCGLPVRGHWTHVTGCIDVRDEITVSRVSAAVRAADLTPGPGPWARYACAAVLGTDERAGLLLEASRLEPVLDAVTTSDGTRPLWRLIGSLKLRGERRPLSLWLGPVHAVDGNRTLHFRASATVDRRTLGIGAHTGLGRRLAVSVTGVAERLR